MKFVTLISAFEFQVTSHSDRVKKLVSAMQNVSKRHLLKNETSFLLCRTEKRIFKKLISGIDLDSIEIWFPELSYCSFSWFSILQELNLNVRIISQYKNIEQDVLLRIKRLTGLSLSIENLPFYDHYIELWKQEKKAAHNNYLTYRAVSYHLYKCDHEQYFTFSDRKSLELNTNVLNK